MHTQWKSSNFDKLKFRATTSDALPRCLSHLMLQCCCDALAHFLALLYCSTTQFLPASQMQLTQTKALQVYVSLDGYWVCTHISHSAVAIGVCSGGIQSTRHYIAACSVLGFLLMYGFCVESECSALERPVECCGANDPP